MVVRRFALVYLAQPATTVRTARPASIRRPSALCWRVGIACTAAANPDLCCVLLARLRGCFVWDARSKRRCACCKTKCLSHAQRCGGTIPELSCTEAAIVAPRGAENSRDDAMPALNRHTRFTSPPRNHSVLLRSRRLAARGVAPLGNSRTAGLPQRAVCRGASGPQNCEGQPHAAAQGLHRFIPNAERSRPRGRSAAKANQGSKGGPTPEQPSREQATKPPCRAR